MLRFLGRTGTGQLCDGPARREMLRIGGLSALGWSLGWPQVLGASPSRSDANDLGTTFGRARSCIVVFLFGGPSQIDTFDPKPDAPDLFRGEFGTIATKTPGVRVCEHLPKLAALTDRYRIIRGMCHEHPRHGWGLYYMLTGRKHSRPDLDAPPTPDDFPGVGSLISKLSLNHPRYADLPREGIPPAVTLPRWNRFLDVPNDYAGEKSGFLGSSFDPWLVSTSSGEGQEFAAPAIELPSNVPVSRLSERRDLLEAIEREIDRRADNEVGRVHEALSQRAAAILASAPVRKAFRLEQESDALRDRYGRHPFGQGLLLARRLVEAGTVLVQVNWHNDGSDVKSPFWDTHKDNFRSLKDRLLPPLDNGLSALLVDLQERGLLETTLVLVFGEFGRTPRVGQKVMNAATDAQGRDHWPHAYSALAAGCGIPGGTYGASDARAAYVVDQPLSPPDLLATIPHVLGIDPRSQIHDRRGRIHPAFLGQPALRLFS